jgi:outer membrane immunogenic protein
MRNVLLAALGLSMLAPAAWAADLGPPPRRGAAPPPPVLYQPTFTWSGFYLGAQLGYGWGDTEASSGPLPGFNQSYAYSPDGWLGGVHAGYNWQASNLVIGLETDIELADISGSGVGTLGSGHTTDIDWVGSFRGRFGFAADRTLFYLTGGLAYGDVAIAGPGYGYSSTRTGWTLGGGLEHAFLPNTTARLEYRYTDLGSDDFSSPGAIDSSDVTFSAVRAGLSWKF